MKNKRNCPVSLAIIILVFLLASCTVNVPRDKTALEAIQTLKPGYRIAVLSVTGNIMGVEKLGTTNYQTEFANYDVSSFSIDDFLEKELFNKLKMNGQFHVVDDVSNIKFKYPRKETATESHGSEQFIALNEKELREFVEKNNVDGILLVSPIFAQDAINRSIFPIYNFGIRQKTAFFVLTETRIYYSLEISILEGKNLKVLVTDKSAWLEAVDNSFWVEDASNPNKEKIKQLEPIIKKVLSDHITNRMKILGLVEGVPTNMQ